ncbi:MAG TPA: FHA domain-containing protein [Gemmatimonadaceae bacterium]|nr:FHA domain-containing protein [Gemmatimonadaceae bacterium]
MSAILGVFAAMQISGSSSDSTALGWVLALTAAVVAISMVVLHIKRRRDAWRTFDDDSSLPPLFFSPGSLAPGEHSLTPARPWRVSPLDDAPRGSVATIPRPEYSAPPPARAAHPAPSAPQPTTVPSPTPDSTSTVRFFRPPDGTLQLLPGRLEIVGGENDKQDIRFVRSRGQTPTITFGRSEGPPHQHVQLHASTVSRMHARMEYEQQRWKLVNLSVTNPVLVNGEELSAVEGTRLLEDGDRIEMGEVVFRFRER